MESNSELLGCVQYVLRPDSVPTSRRTALALQTGVSQASRDDELPNSSAVHTGLNRRWHHTPHESVQPRRGQPLLHCAKPGSLKESESPGQAHIAASFLISRIRAACSTQIAPVEVEDSPAPLNSWAGT